MEVELGKEKIWVNKLITRKKEIIFIEEDEIVPDTKPDILNTINVNGNVCVHKKEVMQDKVKIEGNINTYVMYLPDSNEDNLRALNCTLDFSQNISVPGAKEGMILITKCEIKDIECKVINGRKIGLKASLEISIDLYSNENVEIVNNVQNIQDIQTLQQNFQVNSLIGNGKTNIYAKETLNIDPQDELAEILSVNINLDNKDIKLSYNKVLTKAEANVQIMYLTEDNKIKITKGTIPVVGFIDIQNITDENICDVNYEIKSILIRANSVEEHSIYVELEIEASCMAYEKKEISLIQDLYTPTANLEYTNVVNVGISESKITFNGDIVLNFIYDSENIVNSRKVKVPFEVSIENRYNNSNINVDYEISLKNIKYDFKSDETIQLEVIMQINTKISNNINLNIIDNLQINDKNNTDNEDYDSLILYIVKPGDTIWKIAKRFNSTVNDISRVNGIEDSNKIDVGQKLYIPKFNYIKKDVSRNATEPAIV